MLWSFWDRWLQILAQNSEIQNGGPKYKKLLSCDEIWYSRIFGVAHYESELKIPKLKMADPKWRTKTQKVTWSGWNLVIEGFWDRWLRIQAQNSEIQNESKMADQNW